MTEHRQKSKVFLDYANPPTETLMELYNHAHRECEAQHFYAEDDDVDLDMWYQKRTALLDIIHDRGELTYYVPEVRRNCDEQQRLHQSVKRPRHRRFGYHYI